MAKVSPMPGISHISGSIQAKDGGKLIFKTYTKHVGGKPYTRMVYRSYESLHSRRTPLSEKEIAARQLFADRLKRVNELMAQGYSKKDAWAIVKGKNEG